MGKFHFCSICGHNNAAEAQYCVNCRTRLSEGNVVTGEEATELDRRRRAKAKRKRLALSSLVAMSVLVIGAWIGYNNIGPTRFLPPPSSDISAVPLAGDWPMSQRDPAHGAFNPDKNSVPRGHLKWRFSTVDAQLFSSPAVVGGRVYLSTGDRRILALDAESGDLIWEHKVSAPVNSSPAVAGDLVFVGLRDGRVLALNKESGRKRWEFSTGGVVFSSPAVFQGVLYVGSSDGRLYALDAMTGEKRWSHLTGGRITSDPAVNQAVVAVTSQDRHLYLIDTRTGKRRLAFLTSFVRGSPAFHGNLVFVADDDGVVRAIDWQQRELPFEKAVRLIKTQLFVWKLVKNLPHQKGFVWGFRQSAEDFVGTPVVTDDFVYVGSASGALFALDRATGEKVWEFRGESGIATSPSVADTTIFVGDEDGRLYAIDAVTGGLRWQFKADARISSTPVLANGMLYFSSRDGSLYAIQ